jgi:hypothetical protein
MDVVHSHHYIAHAFVFLMVCYVIGASIVILPLWHTARKAGLNAAVSFWALFPGLGTLIALYYIAFATWKRPPEA